MSGQRNAHDLLPLSHLSMSILMALADRDRHGYGIIKAIERETDGGLRPSSGSLYAALDRLEGEGVVETVDGPDDPDADTRRKYFGLTAFGLKRLSFHSSRAKKAGGSADASAALSMRLQTSAMKVVLVA